jgi:hypothetical protein
MHCRGATPIHRIPVCMTAFFFVSQSVAAKSCKFVKGFLHDCKE